jgi:predicted ATPase
MAVPASWSTEAFPIPRTRLIGRVSERAIARSLLLDEAVPLLTLTGLGGVGKTRLALAIAKDMAPSFVDGLVFVDLAPIRDATLVLTALADAIGIRDPGDRLLRDVLREALHPRQTLLVLDNCEQVLAAAPDLAALLSRCPALQVLATSRVRLNIQGEHELAVPPLALPVRDDAAPIKLTQVESVALFLQRARSGTAWSWLLNWAARWATRRRPWIYVSGRYGASRPISPTKSGRFGWPRSWRTAWDSPVWNQ